MQRPTRALLVWSVLALVCTLGVPRLAAQTGTVRCESRGAGREQCAIDPGARVELVRHLSDTPCRQNSNWGVGSGFIWVAGGCRAEFSVTRLAQVPVPGPEYASATPQQLRACRSEADRRLPAYSYNQIQVEPESRQGNVAYVRWRAGTAGGLCTVAANGRVIAFTTGGDGNVGTTTRITCESRRTEREECRIPLGARVRLARQLSQNPCRLNDTYGQGPSYLWVAEGCRGEFDVMLPGSGGNAGTTRISCETAINTRRECPIPPGAQVRLVGQLGDELCRVNQTYGVGPTYIWVIRGCRGVFEVSRGGVSGGNGTGLPDRVTCESKAGARIECPIRAGGRVQLVRQLSTSPCTLNNTWGTGVGVLWVTKGCRGEFEVR